MSEKAFFFMAVFGMVANYPFSVESRIFRTSAGQRNLHDTFNEINGLGATIQHNVYERSPKSPLKSASSDVSKPISTPVKEFESNIIENEILGQDEGQFRIPLYRQDLIPSSDHKKDSELKKVIIYSRDVKNSSGIPEKKDSTSFTNTLKFIMDFLKHEALKNHSERPVSEAPNTEVSDPPEDVHSIYTPDGEFGQHRLTQKEEGLLSSINPRFS